MNFTATEPCPRKSATRSSIRSALRPSFASRSSRIPLLPDAQSRASRLQCGGRKSNFLAVAILGSFFGLACLPSVAPAAETPTDYEQYVLELINRARANPNAEVTRLSGMTWGDDPSAGTAYPAPQPPSLNEGLPAGTISSAAKAPLAFNLNLIQSARDYSNTELMNNDFSHTFGGTTPTSRAQADGYSGVAGENIAYTASSAPLTLSASLVESLHDNLFVDGNVAGRGHRLNLMDTDYQEIGIGLGSSTTYAPGGNNSFPNAEFVTEDFGIPNNTNPFLTGVVFNDNAHTGFYAPIGEGLGGVSIVAMSIGGNTSASTTTWSSGGYSLQLAPGMYNVTATGAFGTDFLGTFTLGANNIEADAINPTPEPSSFGLMLLGAAGMLARRRRG
jgi:hypothetical protein